MESEGESIRETINNISSILEKINSSFPDRKESVNENDSKDDEIDVTQYGPGRE